MEFQLPLSLIASLIILFFFLLFKLVKEFKINSKNNRAKKIPPGPWKLPVIGNMLHLVGSLPHQALRDLARTHGPLMHLQLGEISSIVISSPRMAEEVLKTHDLAFADRPQLQASKIVLYNNSDMAFAPYGNYWIQIRKICTMELLSTKKVRSFRSIREDEVWSLIESIHASSFSGSPINLTEKLFSLVNAIVCRATFGRRCNEESTLVELIQELVASAGGFDVADLFPSFKWLHFLCGTRPKLEKLHNRYDRLLDNIIKQRTKDYDNNGNSDTADHEEDVLDVLLRIKESGGLDSLITSNTVKAVILDMFTGGTDSSATTIEWAMSELIKTPRVMEKVQAELRQAHKGKKIIHEDDIQGLSYLKLVVKETLRLHPPASMLLPRECREQCEIDGYIIPIKTKVIVNAWAIGRDPEYWDDAESFKPERFNSLSYIDFGGANFQYIPFGAGRRMCPGVLFGLADVELPLAQLLYHFNWKIPSGIKPVDFDMSENFGAVVKRRKKLYLVATPCTSLD